MKPPTARELRDFANGKADHKGKLPHALIVAWNQAHPDRPYPVRSSLGPWSEKHRDTHP